jgi:hypothetical protein
MFRALTNSLLVLYHAAAAAGCRGVFHFKWDALYNHFMYIFGKISKYEL